jgi:murein DD-endopeptidase MepM/ murein hydrolase activator NlpD
VRTRYGARGLIAVPLAAVLTACSVATASTASPPGSLRLADALSGMIWPLPVQAPGEVSSTYGARGVRHHDGLDIRGRAGDPIYAARDGHVVYSGWMSGYGNIVIVDHGNSVTTRYAHASELIVGAGERVTRGQVIARVGATGNATGYHLHFEVLWAGRPIDPTSLLPSMPSR